MSKPRRCSSEPLCTSTAIKLFAVPREMYVLTPFFLHPSVRVPVNSPRCIFARVTHKLAIHPLYIYIYTCVCLDVLAPLLTTTTMFFLLCALYTHPHICLRCPFYVHTHTLSLSLSAEHNRVIVQSPNDIKDFPINYFSMNQVDQLYPGFGEMFPEGRVPRPDELWGFKRNTVSGSVLNEDKPLKGMPLLGPDHAPDTEFNTQNARGSPLVISPMEEAGVEVELESSVGATAVDASEAPPSSSSSTTKSAA